ncbi:MAG: hypothetical protein IKU01_10005 [Bacteroidales bacterium]|nr:hypothetical protein [Bacteroidales bacterium]
MILNKKIFLYVAIFYTLYIIFPLFTNMGIPVWLPSLVASSIMVIIFPKAFFNKIFIWYFVYAFMLLIYIACGRPLTIGIGTVHDIWKFFIENAYILPTLCIFSIMIYLKDETLTRRFFYLSMLILFVSFIIAVPMMQRYGSLREALAEEGQLIILPGLPGYSLMHAYTLFLPILCYGIRAFSGIKKMWSLIGALILCFVIYDTFVTTSLIIMVVIILFTILYNEKSNLLFFLISAVLMCVIYELYRSGLLISFIDKIMPFFSETPVEFKLNDFKQSMIEGQITGGSIVGRMSYHQISWNSFLQKPLFGTSLVGGHSVLIDRLGGMGLVVFIPFLMIIITFIRQMVMLYETKKAKVFFWVGIVTGFVYLYQKGLWGSESWLMYMILMPMGILTFEKQIKKQ